MPYDFNNSEVNRLFESINKTGYTQESVDRIYALLGLGTAPRVPAGLIGNHVLPGRTSTIIVNADGKAVGTRSGEIGDFLNTFGRQAADPYRTYGLGNYLGVAGMLVGGAGAAGAFSGAGAAAGGTTTGSNLGVFANGGTNGLAGVGAGNAGALASSGGIAGGAGIGGTMAGAFGGASGIANSLSGAGNMGWDWGRVLDYGIPLVGGLLEADGAKDAARASAAGSAAALAENRRQYDTTRQDMLPWLEAGRGALGRLNDPNAFTQSPGYNFVRNEGQRGIENSFAARGGAASGNALRALSEFNTGLASQEHNNWWNQQAGMAGLGQTSAQNLGAFGANSANNAGGILQNQGNARASGIAGQTNAWTNILGNLGSVWNRRNG
jgi:hypothetical protein